MSFEIKKLTDKQIINSAFAISITAHIIVLGGIGGLFGQAFKEINIPETRLVELDKSEYRLLPEIKVIGELKQLKADVEGKLQDVVQQEDVIGLQDETYIPHSTEVNKEAQEAMLRYQDMIKQRIESCRHYPLRARRLKKEGIVDIAFTILSSGISKDVKIIHSSGSELLDAEAVNTIQKANPFHPLPDEISKDSVIIHVAIVFSLNQ